jgi:hypothetical protein
MKENDCWLQERKDNYFFKGIKPVSLRSQIQHILEQDLKWIDLSAPPEMTKVIAAAKKHLKWDCYSIEDLDDEDISANDNLNENGSDNSSWNNDKARNSHRHYVKKDTWKKDSANESKSMKPTDIPKENPDTVTDDLTQQLEHLTILTQAIHNQQKNMQSTTQQLCSQNMQLHDQQLHPCYMCGQNNLHGMKDCPETIPFLASGTVKINTKGRVIHVDGRQLPRGIIGRGGIVKVLKDEAANCKGGTSNIELNEESFLVANYEFARLNNCPVGWKRRVFDRLLSPQRVEGLTNLGCGAKKLMQKLNWARKGPSWTIRCWCWRIWDIRHV